MNLISILTYQPEIIILDEPLIGQDPQNAILLLDLLKQHVVGGGTVILVNHSPYATQQYATRVLFFEKGRVLIDDTVPNTYQKLKDLGKTHYLQTNGNISWGSA